MRTAGALAVTVVALACPPASAPAHWTADAGWARSKLAAPHVPLRASPSPRARIVARAPSARLAARITARRSAGRARWLRIAYPRGPAGWVRPPWLVPVDRPRPMPRRLREALRSLLRAAGSRAALVVRDRWGRPLVTAGTARPLVVASLTKLFVVGAALERWPLGAEAGRILRPSDNERSQRLADRLGSGSRRAATRRIVAFAAALGATVQLADGSGLHPGNRAAAGEVVDFLLRIRDRRRFSTFRAALPVPGEGTLQDRLWSVRGRVRAKTGTLDTVTTLAGYARTAGGGSSSSVTFAILMNATTPERGRPLQDAIVRRLVAWR